MCEDTACEATASWASSAAEAFSFAPAVDLNSAVTPDVTLIPSVRNESLRIARGNRGTCPAYLYVEIKISCLFLSQHVVVLMTSPRCDHRQVLPLPVLHREEQQTRSRQGPSIDDIHQKKVQNKMHEGWLYFESDTNSDGGSNGKQCFQVEIVQLNDSNGLSTRRP